MQLNSLVKNNKKKIRVGRGIGSGKGKTSGRGHKGQKSRSGVAIKSFEGGQMPLYRRLPKRGFKSIRNELIAVLNLSKIQNIIDKSKNKISNNLDLKTLKEKNIWYSSKKRGKLMQLNSLVKNNKKKIRVGRGIGSGKGKTSARGHKGQKSRSGVAIKSFEGGQMPLYRRLPKRGFKPIRNKSIAVLNLSKIQNIIDKSKNKISTNLDLKTLKEKNLINKNYKKLKILGSGEIKNNIEISAHFASKQALAKIEKAGGKISIVKK